MEIFATQHLTYTYLLTIKMPDILSYSFWKKKKKTSCTQLPSQHLWRNSQPVILFQMTGMNTAGRLCPDLQIHHLFRTKYFTKVCIKWWKNRKSNLQQLGGSFLQSHGNCTHKDVIDHFAFFSAIIMGDPQTFLKGIAKTQRKPWNYSQKATTTKWRMAAVIFPREQGH